jgi:hypothetical protein
MSSVNGKFVQCRLPSAPAGEKKIVVSVGNLGRACFEPASQKDIFRYELRVWNVLKSPFDPIFEAD